MQARLDAEPDATLARIESGTEWRHFPYAMLAPAVLYVRFHKKPQFDLAVRIGDLLAVEDEKGSYEPRQDSDWDTYMWLETYRLLEAELGESRRARWRSAIERNISLLVHDAKERVDFPWYQSPFIGTSPNHYAQWASVLHLGGLVFRNQEWTRLGARILRRFAVKEQSADGYWGEHNSLGPTIGYDHLTLTGVALYYEHSKDPAVLPALRRSTDFHKYYTFLDGTPVDVINDRNRYWGVSAWGQFAFTHFPDGRRYAEFLTSFFKPETLRADELGRLAQDALYYHAGATQPIPQEADRYVHRLNVEAGVRKTGPWQVALSGIMNTQAINSQFYLDRQGHISVFHKDAGLIITGANSKNQPELATFSEKLMGQTVHMPIATRLQLSDAEDRLSLAYNTFFSDLYVPQPSEDRVSLRFVITGRGRSAEDPALQLQLRLKAGEPLETGAGRSVTLSETKVNWGSAELGGSIRHRGWTLKLDRDARLVWPVYPFNPYRNAPETSLDQAVAVLSVPLRLNPRNERAYIRPNVQEILFELAVPRK